MDEKSLLQIQVLLVEDDDADAAFIQNLLEKKTRLRQQFFRVKKLIEALEYLQKIQKNGAHVIVLLDLGLPDSHGFNSLEKIQEIQLKNPAQIISIIVMTGSQNEEQALEAIRRGAQDYFFKGEVSSSTLERAIRYALERSRLLFKINQKQIEEVQAIKAAHAREQTITAWQESSVTAKLSGVGPLAERTPIAFKEFQERYAALLEEYLDSIGFGQAAPKIKISNLANDIGNQGGGPRDVVDLHVRSVKEKAQEVSFQRLSAISVEGRLLALELMGYLVDHYRMKEGKK